MTERQKRADARADDASSVPEVEQGINEAARLASRDPGQALVLLGTILTPALRLTNPGASGRAWLVRAEALLESGAHQAAMAAARSAHRDLLSRV